MKHRVLHRALRSAVPLLALAGTAAAQIRVPDVPCEPPSARCPDDDTTCSGIVSERGNVTEPGTGREFFLDYSCGLRPGGKAIFILNVHGIGANANWQRHYFPALDYKDEYGLIIATGKSAGISFNSEADDEYVRGMIDYVAEAFSDVDIAFWVAGHSAGGGYSRRWLCNESALRDKAVGSVSLAGGRIDGMGTSPAEAIAAAGGLPPGAGGGAPGGGPPPGGGGGGGPGGPSCGELSHIYSTGSIDSLGGNPVPDTSTLAAELGCGARIRHADIVDEEGGHVYDARDREPPLPGWGREARPGTTEFYEFPNCRDGRVVADFIRLGKGHTEGLEPKVTEEIVRLVVEASR